MQARTEMQQGWDFAIGILGTDVAAHMGQDYVSAVEAAIAQLEESINNHQYRNQRVEQLQGYMLEEWAAGTFNVDAAAAGSKDHAFVLHSNKEGSVDILLASGKQVSAKSWATPEETAIKQARFNRETGQASYHGQDRLVPSDKLPGAVAKAQKEALRNRPIRPDVADAYAETESRLTDTVKNEEGVSSKTATRKELDQMARESKEKNFRAEEHGVTAESAIKLEYLLKQSLKAGFTSAAVSIAFQLAPEIYKSIDYLIKHGEIDIQRLKKMGTKGLSAGAEGFLRGSIASALFIMCKKGVFGEALKSVNPSVLGAVVALVLQTVKNSILVAAGKMTAQQMGAAFVDSVIISGGYLLGAYIGGIIGQVLGFELPVIGYLLGTLIGTSICVIYNIGKKKLISFCVDTGFTCFGLVEQDYELPEEVLHELGVETIPIPRTQIRRVNIQRTQLPTAGVDRIEYETIDITVLRRGVLGVNKIGYVL